MNNTPRTDAAAFDAFDGQGGEVVFAAFASQLERERNSLQDQRDFCMGEIERLRKERDEARNIARWWDDYEAMEALLCEMQGLRDELVEVKCERDQWRIQCERAEMALQDIATGTSCRECSGEDQARLAKDVIKTASNL